MTPSTTHRTDPLANADSQNPALIETLRLAVPLHMASLSGLSASNLVEIATRSASVVGSKGDVLQFHSPKRGAAAEAFNALAKGLAVAALVAWGGCTFLGVHWCTVPNCPGPDAKHPQPQFTDRT
ncbi:hypothetical protein [Streptomyces sp. NPDC054865]